jgi:hypothetical protein
VPSRQVALPRDANVRSHSRLNMHLLWMVTAKYLKMSEIVKTCFRTCLLIRSLQHRKGHRYQHLHHSVLPQPDLRSRCQSEGGLL